MVSKMISLKITSMFTVLAFLSTTARAFHVGLRPTFKQFPYSALIIANYNDTTNDSGEMICSGTLVSEKFVITATTCVKGSKNFRIKLGPMYIRSTDYIYDHVITNATINDSDDHLLTLITLDPQTNYSRGIQAISFPPTPSIFQLNDAIDANNSAILVGWRANEEGLAEEKWLPSRVKDFLDCVATDPRINARNTLCAEGEKIDGKYNNLCVSAGAPLVIFNTALIGIGLDVCVENGTQKFARVNAYVEWIRRVLLVSKYEKLPIF